MEGREKEIQGGKLSQQIDILLEDQNHNQAIIENLYEHKKVLEDTISKQDLVRHLNSFKYNIWREFEAPGNLGDQNEVPEFRNSQNGNLRCSPKSFELSSKYKTPGSRNSEKLHNKLSASPGEDGSYKKSTYMQDWLGKSSQPAE